MNNLLEENPRRGFSSIFYVVVPATRSRSQYFTIFPFHPEKLPLMRAQSAKNPPPAQRTPRKNTHLPLPPHNIHENYLKSNSLKKSICSSHTQNVDQREETSPYLKRLTHRISPKILLSSVFASVTNTFNGKPSSSITFGPG